MTDTRLSSRVLLDWALGLTSAGAASAFLTQLVGTPNGMIAALQALLPWAVPPLLVVVLVASSTGRHRIGLSAAGVGFAHLVLMMPVAFPTSGPAPDPAATPFRLMSTNVLYSNDDFAGIGETIQRIRPDVIAFSEVTETIAENLLALPVADGYSYSTIEPGRGALGMMMWSKFPISSSGSVPAAWRSIDAVVETPSGPVRVVAIHPPPPVFDHAAWSNDLALLQEIVQTSDLPTAIIGDLNASYFHPIFRRAVRDAGLLDTTRATGNGDQFTWPTDEATPPFVALDHVLIDAGLAVLGTEIARIPGSDHAAVVATVSFSRS